MRKSKRKRKNEDGQQIEINYWQSGELSGTSTGGTGTRLLSRAEMLSLLERQRTLTENLLERVLDYGNINRAYRQVMTNSGSGGIDGMETTGLKPWLGKHINTLREEILTERYEVSAVRKVEIRKPEGGMRMLCIPTVKDRLIQQCIYQEMNRYYEPLFSESSYGFRPGRSAHQAIKQATKYIKEGKEWVVDIDLEKFFDKIDHDRLMQRLSKGIGDKRLLRLIRAYLKAGIMEGGLTEQRIAGTPQGGPLSPLLSNIVLDELDKELESRGHSFCRYADDCNIYVNSRKAGERVMISIVSYIEKKLKLKVNYAKSGVRHCSDVKFLGYTIMGDGMNRVADKSIKRLKDRIREITRRNRGAKFDTVIKELNFIITGWSAYFKLANTWLSNFIELDGWIRRKLRCYRLKQCGRRFTIVKLLSTLDIPENKSWNAVLYTQGWWHLSNKTAVNQAMNPKWFALQGLLSISDRMKV